MQSSTLVFLVATLVGVKATCDPTIVDKLTSSWQGNVPTNTISKLAGKITYLTVPSLFTSTADNVTCAQTTIDASGKAATTTYFLDPTPPVQTTHQVSQKDNGVLEWKDASSTINNMYVVYQSKNVLAYFVCQPSAQESYDAYAGLAVVNIADGDLESSEQLDTDLAAGYNALDKLNLGLNLVARDGLYTQCKF